MSLPWFRQYTTEGVEKLFSLTKPSSGALRDCHWPYTASPPTSLPRGLISRGACQPLHPQASYHGKSARAVQRKGAVSCYENLVAKRLFKWWLLPNSGLLQYLESSQPILDLKNWCLEVLVFNRSSDRCTNTSRGALRQKVEDCESYLQSWARACATFLPTPPSV